MNKTLFKNEEMVCLLAPDGTPQLSVAGGDMVECLSYHRLLHLYGISESLDDLLKKGFKIISVKVTVVQTGDEEAAFQKLKKKLQ